MKFAAIIAFDEDNNPGLLNCVQIESEKDQAYVTQLHSRWSDYFQDQQVKTFIVNGNRSDFLQRWQNPNKEFRDQFAFDKNKK